MREVAILHSGGVRLLSGQCPGIGVEDRDRLAPPLAHVADYHDPTLRCPSLHVVSVGWVSVKRIFSRSSFLLVSVVDHGLFVGGKFQHGVIVSGRKVVRLALVAPWH